MHNTTPRQNLRYSRPLSLLLLAAAALGHSAQAQPTPAAAAASAAPDSPVQLETVSMTLQRDGSLIPYAKMNEILGLMQKHGEGLFFMEFKLAFKEPKPASFTPKLAVQHNDGVLPVKLAEDGSFQLPLLPAELGKDADLARNWKRGSASLSASLRLSIRPEQLTMGTVRRIARLAHKLRSEMLPWYLRPLFPQFEGVRVCSGKPAWELEWREKGQLLALPLTADPKDVDPDAIKGQAPRSCTVLSGQESWPDEARLIAPPDSRLSVRVLSSK
ncbi:hypothetical protein [Roseateles sp.]|uniref:hypothetical protein n=1 Tax=Roseateles sp. TaxID=1971397 RepID=UPI003D1499C3